jgi:SAM-dependent methyltransferase
MIFCHPRSFGKSLMNRKANDQRLRSIIRNAYRRILPLLPLGTYRWVIDQRNYWGARLPQLFVRFGSLRRLSPISPAGGSRGMPIDRYYIEGFLKRHVADIHGRVLECYEGRYTKLFGAERVVRGDVLNIELDNPNSTFIGDLAGANNLPTEAFDCIIVTQVLQYIYDLRAAITTLKRIVKPGGVILATMPGITPVHVDPWPWTWSLTTVSARRLFRENFCTDSVSVESHGNILAASAFLYGISCEELTRAELDHYDPSYAVTIAVRAVKPEL